MAQRAEQLKSDDAIKTYRYLRIGMIGAVVLLGASIAIEKSKVPCYQTSLSAYYYTPVRAVFVGSLIAIGLSLIVYKGRGSVEDFFLNLAGMLTPVVAVAPTMDVGRCWSFPPISLPENDDGTVADWVLRNIDNNFYALLFTGAIGLGVAAIIAIGVNLKQERPAAPNGGLHLAGTARMVGRGLIAPIKKGARGTRFALFLTALALVAGLWLIRNWDAFNTRAHGFAAAGAIGFLILAIVANVLELWNRRSRKLGVTYLGIAGAMIAGGAVISIWRLGNEHTLFWLELWELALFALYWCIQTKENWKEEIVLPKNGVGTFKWAETTGGRLTILDRLDLFGQAIPAEIGELNGRLLSRFRHANEGDDPDRWNALVQDAFAEVSHSRIANTAQEMCKEESERSEAWLRNHSYRTFAIGVVLGEGLRFEPEVLFVAAMLHDLGLTPAFKQGADTYPRKDAPCFAVRGSGVAYRLARAHDWPDDRAEALSEAISIHLNVGVPRFRGVEAHLLNAASALDVVGFGRHKLPKATLDGIEEAWPRGVTFCEDIWSAWDREASGNKGCRGAFLNRWGRFERRLRKTCHRPEPRSTAKS